MHKVGDELRLVAHGHDGTPVVVARVTPRVLTVTYMKGKKTLPLQLFADNGQWLLDTRTEGERVAAMLYAPEVWEERQIRRDIVSFAHGVLREADAMKPSSDVTMALARRKDLLGVLDSVEMAYEVMGALGTGAAYKAVKKTK